MRRLVIRSVAPAVLAVTAAATLTVAAAPAADAVGESSKCTINWTNFPATVGKNGWNLRTGPSSAYVSRGLLYRGDRVTVLCSRGAWNYTQLPRRSKSGLPAGTRGWVREDGLVSLAG
jgi:uncharacterized protein YgiM (DUF1202 family)